MSTVLIVEDSSSQRECISHQLSWCGMNVIEAGDGVEALEKIWANSPDLVLLDVIMPRLDGYGVCRLIKANPDTRNIPVVFLTGKEQKLALYWGIKYAEAYIGKPWQPRELLDTLKRVLLDTENLSESASAQTWTEYGCLILDTLELYKCRVDVWTNCSSQVIKLYRSTLAAFKKALSVDPTYSNAAEYLAIVQRQWDYLEAKLGQAKPCKMCRYYHGKDGINCALYPSGREEELCRDWDWD